MKEGTGGAKADQALRVVRLKRECSEAGECRDSPHETRWHLAVHFADQEYRKAIHWLETLRIRRVKTLEAGYNVRHSDLSTYASLTCPIEPRELYS